MVFEELMNLYCNKINWALHDRINHAWINVIWWEDDEIIITADINGIGISKHYRLRERILAGTVMRVVDDFVARFRRYLNKEIFETRREAE